MFAEYYDPSEHAVGYRLPLFHPMSWNIYAQMLSGLGHGYPLWHPGPEIDENYGFREVDVGAVGYVDDGRFRHLFNSLRSAEDSFNKDRVPQQFEQLHRQTLQISGPEYSITQESFLSQTVRETNVSAEAGIAAWVIIVPGDTCTLY